MFLLWPIFDNLRGQQHQERILFVKLNTYIVNFLQQNIIGNHNIEGFKQVSNHITCL
jgi:hypothetical protein